MFVAESSIFDPNKIQIRVSSMDGVDAVLEVDPHIFVDSLKIQISSHLYDPVESIKTSLYHRLLHIRTGNMLDEEKTVLDCGVRDKDELLLIQKRVPGPPLDGSLEAKIREDSRKTPTADDVKQATQGIAALHTERTKSSSPQRLNFKVELRKILISLIDSAQKILCFNPEAAKIFEAAEQCISEQTTSTAEPVEPLDEVALHQLTNMGFTESKAQKALVKNRMCTERAIQWLLEHDGDSDVEDMPPQTTATADKPNAAKDNSPESLGATAAEATPNQTMTLAQMSGPEKVKKMLEGFRAYRRREFKPNPKALRILVEMGFEEGDALDALCIHGNKQEEACDWLLSGGHLTGNKDLDLEESLDTSSPVYKAIMENPNVQLGLCNPKSLLAFLTILENPNSTQQWINDPDTGPMLLHISRIYHAERNAPSHSEGSSDD